MAHVEVGGVGSDIDSRSFKAARAALQTGGTAKAKYSRWKRSYIHTVLYL